ncbi:MAG: hypothetical protein IK045_04030 [Bacteroidales bacterium]|nr:hypothetical protein [Bacteroidales bacterium]
MNKRFFHILLISVSTAVLLMAGTSCKKIDKVWSLQTGKASDFSKTSVVLEGTFNAAGAYFSARHGIVLAGQLVGGEPGGMNWFYADKKGSFQITVEGLMPGVDYEWYAFAEIDHAVEVGESKYFRAPTDKGLSLIENAVDLGTSVLWAPYNLGASTPDGYGSYFAWGEVAEKDDYTEANYTASSVSVLDARTDAAAHILGGPWRMPTYEEFDELRTKCTVRSWQQYNGVYGLKIFGVGEGEGNWIFLPAAGKIYPEPNGLMGDGSECEYSSSSLKEGETTIPVWGLLYRDLPSQKILTLGLFQRIWGLPIRPVMDK